MFWFISGSPATPVFRFTTKSFSARGERYYLLRTVSKLDFLRHQTFPDDLGHAYTLLTTYFYATTSLLCQTCNSIVDSSLQEDVPLPPLLRYVDTVHHEKLITK